MVKGKPFYLAPPEGRIRREHREQMTTEFASLINQKRFRSRFSDLEGCNQTGGPSSCNYHVSVSVFALVCSRIGIRYSSLERAQTSGTADKWFI